MHQAMDVDEGHGGTDRGQGPWGRALRDEADSEYPEQFVETWPALVLAVLCTMLVFGIAGWSIYHHLLHYTKPEQQRYIIRLLLATPLYSLSSYEAFIIYSFLVLILEYAGGESNCVAQIENLPPLRPPVPCCCITPRARNGRLIRACKQGTLQFVVVKPVVGCTSLLVLGLDLYYDETYQYLMLTVYNISYTLALYYLLYFYLATKEVVGRFNPVLKFGAVKIIVFATYYQSLLVRMAPNMSTEQAVLWNDFILCIEMVLFSVLLACAFSHAQYWTESPSSDLLANASTVVSVHDVMQDAYHNFMPAYQDYVLQREEGDHVQVVEKIKSRSSMARQAILISIPGLRTSHRCDEHGHMRSEAEMDDLELGEAFGTAPTIGESDEEEEVVGEEDHGETTGARGGGDSGSGGDGFGGGGDDGGAGGGGGFDDGGGFHADFDGGGGMVAGTAPTFDAGGDARDVGGGVAFDAAFSDAPVFGDAPTFGDAPVFGDAAPVFGKAPTFGDTPTFSPMEEADVATEASIGVRVDAGDSGGAGDGGGDADGSFAGLAVDVGSTEGPGSGGEEQEGGGIHLDVDDDTEDPAAPDSPSDWDTVQL